jgi:ATP-binding cassette, subfamily A (ABC1), member 3
VPVCEGRTLADLFAILAQRKDFPEYTVERLTLESVFLKVLKENEFSELPEGRVKKRRFCF